VKGRAPEASRAAVHGGDREDGVKNQGCEHRAILATTEPHQPWAVVPQVKMTKEVSNICIRSSCHENHCLRLAFATGDA
jgi:hypothetical protein